MSATFGSTPMHPDADPELVRQLRAEMEAEPETARTVDEILDENWRTAPYTNATSADRPAPDGPVLDGTGEAPRIAAERLSGVERGDGAREAVEDLLGPRVMGVGAYGQAVADGERERLHGQLAAAYRLGRADERAAVVDAEAARRALTPHGLTAEQVLAAVGNILGAASADEAARLVWAVRDYVPASGPGRAAGGEGRG